MATAEVPIRKSRLNFSGNQFYRHDFSNRTDLVGADFRNCRLIECNFDSSDCSYALFDGSNLYGASFQNTRLYRACFKECIMGKVKFSPRDGFGVTMSMDCVGFNEAEVSPVVIASYLYIFSQIKIPDELRNDLHNIAKKVIGEERFKQLVRVIEDRAL